MMEWETVVYQLIELVKSTAPKLWVVASRQVHAGVVGSVVALVGLAGAVIYLLIMIPRLAAKEEEHKYDHCYEHGWGFAHGFSIAGVVLLLCIILYIICAVIMRCINPDFYAIKVIMDLAR